jgi:alkaline phosphatase
MRAHSVAFSLAIALALPSSAEPTDWQAEGRSAIARARARNAPTGPAKNVILFVGDGMGVSTVTAARILDGQLRGETGEENALAFERLPYVALSKTYNTNQQVPDSAGTMTAMVTGVKTRAGMISVGPALQRGDHTGVAANRLATLFEQAEARGLATGVVTTTSLTHATPAACYAHAPDRDWENDAELSDAARADGFPDLARQLLEFDAGDGLEIALGGGRQHFLPETAADPEYPDKTGKRKDGRDLMKEWGARGPGHVAIWNASQLAALDLARAGPVLGLFEPSHLQFEAHRSRDPGGEPSLAELTAAALTRLARDDDGFVLMVEGGRIDHGHHASSAFLALHDAVAFSQAIATALARVDLDETLVVVTADHSHTFTIAGYPQRGNDILGLVRATDAQGDPGTKLMRDLHGRPYTTLGYANGPGHVAASDQQPAGSKRFPHFPRGAGAPGAERPDLTEVATNGPGYLQESSVPLRTETHGGEDVAIYAGGPGAELFHGVQEQSYIYHVIVDALGWTGERRRGLFERLFGS